MAEAKANGATSDSYNRIFKNVISSSRFSEATKQIEKLKKTENGAERTTKQFNKALLDTINSSAYKGSNLEQLINYLKNDLGFNIDISGEEQLMSLSSMFVEIKDKQDKATQSNLLFADSFSKITSARKAFEEGLSSVETGTEDFTSYADSYEKAMELLNKGYDLDNGVLMAHVERLISDKQLKKLGYDADKVKAYLQEHLKGVFGDKDTDAPGNGLIDKIEKNADEDGKIYAKDKNGNIDKTRELASYKDGNWHISDDTKDIEALGKEFGMTTDQILSCIKAMKTFSDVDLNDTETIIDKLKEEGKVFDPEEEKKKKVKKLADKYNSYTNGNVDYNKRPVISAKNMQEAGWKEFPNGSTATTYSSGMDVGKYSIEITPILENGEVLSPDALDKYVKELVGEGSIEDLLKSDKKKLIINAKEGSYEENSEYWDSWNKKLDKIKQKHLELTKELTGTKPAVNLKQLESDMQSEGYSSKDIFDTIQQLKNDENVITVEIDAKTKSPKVAEELEKLGIFSGTGTYGKGKSKWTSTTTDDIDKATQALKTFGLTGQEAYEKLKGLDIYETQKDGTQKFLTDVEKIESVIKTFDSDLDLNLYKSINLKGEVPDGGKRTEVINVVPLKEELEKKGYSSQFIDEYIKSLEQQNHVVTIDTSMEFTQKGDVTTVEEQLVAAGVATKDKDGKYTIDVKETVTLLKNTGADSDDIISFLNNLKSAAEQDGSLTLTFSSNVSSIEGEVNNVYQDFDDTKNKANEAKSATEEAKASAEAYNNTSLENIESSWSRTAEQVERNGAAIATAKEMLDAINGSTYTYNVKPVETRPTNVPSDFVGPVLPSKFGVANGTANISGTALAGGNWGTAPGGKTLTGELG